MEQLDSQPAAADIRLRDEILDRIDEIVPPGTNFQAADAGWQHPALTTPQLRRRGDGGDDQAGRRAMS